MTLSKTQDQLIAAVIDLEVAVDEYTADQFRQSRMRPGSRPSAWAPTITRQLRDRIIDASTEVAAAMTDGDVSLVDSTYAGNVMPREIRDDAAAAEMGSLRALRAARAHPYSPSTVPSIDGAGCLFRPQIGPGEWSLTTCRLPERAHAALEVAVDPVTHPHPFDGTHEGLRRDCPACDAEDVS